MNDKDGYVAISFRLSPDGLKHIDDIVEILFAYFRQISDTGIDRWRFDDMKTMNDLEFRYLEPVNIAEAVVGTTVKLNGDYPIEDVVVADHLWEEFQPQAITMILNRITPDNTVNVSILFLCTSVAKNQSCKVNVK